MPRPSHWTYREPDSAHLEQGDIIERSDILNELMQSVLPHFADPKNLAFVVTTQTCDLVRRPECKTPYIGLAAIRQFDSVMPAIIRQTCGSARIPGALNSKHKSKASDLVTRIVNQNEQALGLFYLHQDLDAGIAVPSVALLRVTISLRQMHYESLLQARRCSLSPAFQAKFGWLLGNLYSRVATPDWSDQSTQNEFRTLRNDLMTSCGLDEFWISEEVLKAAQLEGIGFDENDPQESMRRLKKVKPKKNKDAALDIVEAIATELFENKNAVRKLRQRIKNDPSFTKLFK